MMKTVRVLLAGLPLLFLAAGIGHQAFGPVRFGMPTATARSANNRIIQSYHSHRLDTLTAADVRAQFVTIGALRLGKNAALEAATPVHFYYKAEPFVTEVSVVSRSEMTEAYASQVRQAWETLQDIGDCKFPRKEAKGQFPPIEILALDNPAVSKGTYADLVTDTWEIEGIRIELYVRMYPPLPEGVTPGGRARPYPVYYAGLRATEIALKQ